MYKHLISQQRSQICALKQQGLTQKAIADIVGCHVSTISRELRRNCGKRGKYTWRLAQELASERAHRCAFNARVPDWVLHKSVSLLKEEQWSPRQISGALALEDIHISHERIYQEIRNDPTGELAAHTRHGMRYRKKSHVWKKAAGRSLIPDRVPIKDRPPEADGTRMGDWEMDLVVGKEHKSAVLTLVERSTNYFLQCKVDSKKPAEVARCAWRLLLPFKDKVLTITTDNGVEFMNHKWLAERLDTTVYFADPYSSWQKGAIENSNKLFRQYFPKGTDFRLCSQAFLDQIQKKINRRPREKLHFSTPVKEFYKYFR